MNDTRNPTFVLNFFNWENTDSLVPLPIEYVKDEIEQTEQLHRIISILIRQADDADKLEEKENLQIKKGYLNTSIADEIRKLADLKDEGLITNEEFDKQKKNLML